MNTKIEVKKTKKYGRGLYATRKIKKGEIVEISPVVELESESFRATKLNVYVFGWKQHSSALALGYGSLFNHSGKRPNVTYNPVLQERVIIFVAKRDIPKGNQLFIDYGYDPHHGIEVTERNLLVELKRKYESKDRENAQKDLAPEAKPVRGTFARLHRSKK